MKLTLTSGFTWFPPTHWRALLCLGTDSMALPAWLSLPDPSLHLKPTKTSTAARVAANIPAIFTISASSVLLQLLITRPPRGGTNHFFERLHQLLSPPRLGRQAFQLFQRNPILRSTASLLRVQPTHQNQ